MIPRGRRGVSNIIAVMILVAISVTGSLLFYAYVSGVFGQLQGAQPKQAYMDQIALEFYDWTTSTLKVQIRNVGSSNIRIVSVYIAGKNVTNIVWGNSPDTCTGGNLPVQKGCYIELTKPTALALQPGFSYPITLITYSGAKISFSAVYTQTG